VGALFNYVHSYVRHPVLYVTNTEILSHVLVTVDRV
jgi:hypothetical protein